MYWWDFNTIGLTLIMTFLGMQSLFREVSCEALDSVSEVRIHWILKDYWFAVI